LRDIYLGLAKYGLDIYRHVENRREIGRGLARVVVTAAHRAGRGARRQLLQM
jgi:hypothetical protein